MTSNDYRAVTLLVYHALRQAVESFDLDQEPSDVEIQEALIAVISLLPRMGVMKSKTTGKVYLQWIPLSSENGVNKYGESILDIQPIIDSIRVVWKDYLGLMDQVDASKG